MSNWLWSSICLGLVAAYGCTGANRDTTSDADEVNSAGTAAALVDTTPVVFDGVPNVPGATPAVTVSSPNAPPFPGATWTPAPELTGVKILPNRDSAILVMTQMVAGTKDLRAFVLRPGVTVTTDANGGEIVSGAYIYHAGYRQRSREAEASFPLLQMIEAAGLTLGAQVVIESIDRPGPFPGIIGSAHVNKVANHPAIPTADRVPFSFYTPAEIMTTYGGSVIINGQGQAPTLAQQAAWIPPTVLARTTIQFTPGTGTATSTPTTFFDGFDDPSDQFVPDGTLNPYDRAHAPGNKLENSKWYVRAFNGDPAQVYVSPEGQLHTVITDWEYDVFSSITVYPKRVAHFPADPSKYLQIVFDVANEATQRRYWLLNICGSNTPGATMNAEGDLLGDIIEPDFFYDSTAPDPSLLKWNCFQLFPRDGWPFTLAPTGTNPESDLHVMVNKANTGYTNSVRDLNPDQYHNRNIGPPGWYRQQTSTGTLIAAMLDDQQLIAPNTQFQVFLKRNQVVVFVNGQQRMCTKFASNALTMAEAAIGYGFVLYHTAAEHEDLKVSYWSRTGQRQVVNNTPFADHRTWDNMGFQEDMGLPASFDASKCYTAP